MTKHTLPASEWSDDVIQKMKDRMAVSYHKYGAVRDAYPHKVNALESMHRRLEKYLETGNLEWVIDAMNFLLIENLCPSHPNAHFRATDSNESIGRAAYDSNFEGTAKSNKELTDAEWKELHG